MAIQPQCKSPWSTNVWMWHLCLETPFFILKMCHFFSEMTAESIKQRSLSVYMFLWGIRHREITVNERKNCKKTDPHCKSGSWKHSKCINNWYPYTNASAGKFSDINQTKSVQNLDPQSQPVVWHCATLRDWIIKAALTRLRCWN